MDLSFRQAVSPAMHEFVVPVIRLWASLPRDALEKIADIAPLIDQTTEGEVAEVLCANAKARPQSFTP
jgi:hypothetical protein